MIQGDTVRTFLVSENGLIVSSKDGIHLYHIPELRAVGDDSNLVPVWSWGGDASRYLGTLNETGFSYPALWLQGSWFTHTLEFDVDESGCFPVVVSHHITEGEPAYHVTRHLKLQGRKAMGVFAWRGEALFKTGMLGKPDLTRQLRARLPGVYEGPWHGQDEVKYAGLDEVTGRIMVAIGTVSGQRQVDVTYARRLCLADLPT